MTHFSGLGDKRKGCVFSCYWRTRSSLEGTIEAMYAVPERSLTQESPLNHLIYLQVPEFCLNTPSLDSRALWPTDTIVS